MEKSFILAFGIYINSYVNTILQIFLNIYINVTSCPTSYWHTAVLSFIVYTRTCMKDVDHIHVDDDLEK